MSVEDLFRIKSEMMLRGLKDIFFILTSSLFRLYITSLRVSGFQFLICCLIISLSFQKIGGLAFDSVVFKSLLIL